MMMQKRIAVINDVTGFGRCSVAVAQPVISAMKVQACVLPTAILSMHTGFEDFFLYDFTSYMKRYMDNWKEHGITFDGISTGFLGSVEQIQLVERFIHMFKEKDCQVIMDPVMGDYGRLYPSYTDAMCDGMKHLLPYADALTPNLTEACRLLDIEYTSVKITEEELEKIARALSEKGPDKIVLTGLQIEEGKLANYIYERGRPSQMLVLDKIGEDRSGTGDVFSSIVSAALVKGVSFSDAVQKAVDFINTSIAYTVQLDVPTRYGLCFEEHLAELAKE